MRVVHVSKVSGIAGSENHLLQLLPGLQQAGYDVHMLMLEDPSQTADNFAHAVTALHIPVERLPIYHHLDPTLPRRLRKRLSYLAPTLVHTHLVHADFYALPAAVRAGIPVRISSRHNDNAFRKHPIFAWVNRRIMRHAQRVIAISAHVAEFMAHTEGLPPEAIVTIPYGFDAPPHPADAGQQARQALGLPETSPVVGFVGRLIPQKGVETLLQAFQQVTEPHAQLVIIGDGPLRGALEAAAPERVVFTGWQPNADRLMPAFDVLAVPSRWEGFGLVTLEAMHARRPVVASRVSALPEIIEEGVTGLLVRPDDPVELAKALNTLLNNPTRIKQMGRAGYERLRAHFSPQVMIDTTHALYQKQIETQL